MRFTALSRLARALLLLAALAAPVADARAGIAPAGTTIVNVATATYFNPRLGITETVRSNAVEALVLEVPALEVVGRSELLLSRGAFAEHHFQVTNTGNTPLTVTADVNALEESGILTDGEVLLDRDFDGVIGPNDPLLRGGVHATPALAARFPALGAGANPRFALAVAETVNLVYRFRVTATASVDEIARSNLEITATSDTSGAGVVPIGTTLGLVTIVSAGLEIGKSVQRRTTGTGDLLAYRLVVQNNAEVDLAGYGEVFGDRITVDGARRSGVLVRDEIPLNTVFEAFGPTGVMQPLYHLRGDAPQAYVSRPPADPARVDAVAFLNDGDYPVGRSTTLNFSVFLSNRLGSVDVRNTAETFFGSDGGFDRALSNEVFLRRTLQQNATLSFVDPSDLSDTHASELDRDTRLRLVSGACNTSGAVDSVMIRVVSTITRDIETVRATETGPNTGEFLGAALPMTAMRDPVSGDGVMATEAGDTLLATAECGDIAVEDALLIAPGGFVFHSLTNAAIEGATVQLVDEGGQIIATARSDARGYFGLGRAAAGRYRLNVLPPADMAFPAGQLSFPGFDRKALTRASFGAPFDHGGGVVALIDIPLDPFYGIPLTLEKSANKRRVQSGEFVTYTLTARNNMNQALMRAEITDRLPEGAVLVAGSVTLDGAPQPDPRREGNRDHVFELGTLEPLGERELQYILRFTPTARSGSRSNLAVLTGFQAGTGSMRSSGVAEARVKLNTSGGVFSREGTIIGSVFLDCNANGIRDGAGEVGVPGVQIITQEGLMVVTDEAGKYSLFGLRPVSHVLALQTATLPAGTRPLNSRAADMLRPMSRMVPLKRGELRAEDFPLEGCTAAALSRVSARAARLEGRDDADANLLGDLPIDTTRPDSRSVRSEAGLPTATQMLGASPGADAPADTPAAGDLVAAARTRAEGKATLEEIIKDLDATFGFMDLETGTRLTRRALTVRVKGPADLTMALFLNDKPVPASRIGERVTWEGGNVQALEYVALRLGAGPNQLKVIGKDPFGNTRKSAEITLHAPGDADRIEIIAPAEASATAGAVVPVVVRVLDGLGAPVQAAATVTLDARLGRWDVTDIRTDQPGLQAYIDNGEATFNLLAPQVTGTDTLTVRSGLGSASAEIRFLPDLSQRVMVGIIEGSVSLKGAGELIRDDELSPFEDTATGLRGEVYLRGRIRGDHLLTLRYSSDRDTDDRLFRDIRADEYYPIYGDNSERGFDAQSSTNLFVKVERGGSYVLYGDIAVEPTDPAFRLGGYRDVTTGAKAHWQGEKVNVTVFAARTAHQTRIVEIPGRGISGPYGIDLSDFREGSDQVDLITRDRDTGEIIDTQPLRRLTDYLFDFFRNTVVFNVPVRQADDDGNPVFIRISYQTEAEQAGKFWLYGAEALVDLGENTRAGFRAIHSDGPRGTDQRFRIHAAFVTTRLSFDKTLELEVARAEGNAGQAGLAARLAYEWTGKDARLRFEATIADEAFTPPGSSVRAGATRLSFEYERQLDADRALTLSAEYLDDRVNEAETLSATLGLRRRVDERTVTRSGLKFAHDLRAGADATSFSFLKSAEWRPESHEGVKLDFDVEIPPLRDAQGRVRIGGEYEMDSGIVLTGEAEFTFGPQGDALRYARLGADYRINGWLDGRSEISGDRLSGERRVIQRFTGQMTLNERTALRFGIEHSRALGDGGSALTSVTLGGKWASEDGRWIAEGSIDQTFEAAGYTLYTDFGLAGEVSPGLTLMGRSRFALDRRGDGPDNLRHRLRIGAAYRPTDDARLNVLAWYEHRLEQKTRREEDHIWSLAATYDATPRLKLNAKYAGQYRRLRTGAGVKIGGLMQLVQGGVTVEAIPNRLEASLNAYHMWDGQGSSTQAVGVEAGYVLDEGVMVSVGYNVAGDRYAGDFSHFQDALYARVRIKLDDTVWDRLDGFMGN